MKPEWRNEIRRVVRMAWRWFGVAVAVATAALAWHAVARAVAATHASADPWMTWRGFSVAVKDAATVAVFGALGFAVFVAVIDAARRRQSSALLWLLVATLAALTRPHTWIEFAAEQMRVPVDIAIALLLFMIGAATLAAIRLPWAELANLSARRAIARVGWAFAVLVVGTALAEPMVRNLRAGARPNLVVIVVDTLRYDHLGYAGYARDTSPNMDALAAESIRFRRAYSHAPWTSPSVAALLTSRYPAEMGFSASNAPPVLPSRMTLLAERMRRQGYATEAVVSHTYVGAVLGFDQGFDAFDQSNARGHAYVSSPSVLQRVREAIQRLRDRPFFLFVHLFDPHYAYIEHSGNRYSDSNYEGPVFSGIPYGALNRNVGDYEADDLAQLNALYDSEIAFTDAAIGAILDALSGAELDDQTVVVLTADHGEMFRDRGDEWIGHGIKLTEELIHVPLLIRWPGVAPYDVTQTVAHVDIVPTLVSRLELAAPDAAPMRGRVLPLDVPERWELLSGAPVFAETLARGRWLQSATTARFKLVADRLNGTHALFDLAAPTREVTDVANVYPGVTQALLGRLDDWSETVYAAKADDISLPNLSDEQVRQLKSLGYLQ